MLVEASDLDLSMQMAIMRSSQIRRLAKVFDIITEAVAAVSMRAVEGLYRGIASPRRQ
ncbi:MULTISPECIES: hypothetical protein [unclassified Mesorhizobium]|uniref:hypothetical protein n=1 Tax=unclassified Mesorhizobium TaxID=325217 RepID=UPI0015E4805B|nr:MULTISPECIES: hypothetical protein [unclassified Mesorhizobium]MBZ9700210.1 hypothetical protein [Mesorhizobium sp. CO1-1-3]MBZ9892913.1 hypothetical protein [Mesorhizobium sp. BR1-1-6]MBZ9919163.1 hypothetical protein [Mesorhizobium sp. BR1-1-7]MBZ9949989.1 hypothetical protein [Mesorhizobium sp. BR1-1-11]MBZ9952387.1 hypothetical protein [Mesorhizobium sp. BR1-1-15]